ncbi:unnamed protein product, partial [Gongylonema pulchrum]|uniref:DUF4025 domain-containing protein n=1 Tax=Gongylonema pulchrum TaxID=637853 RepID=A0A183DKL9_9BILA
MRTASETFVENAPEEGQQKQEELANLERDSTYISSGAAATVDDDDGEGFKENVPEPERHSIIDGK